MKRHLAGLKADWQLYLRRLRAREIGMIFGGCPHDAFPCGLELGAGDGFQSTLLAPYVCRLTASDYRPFDYRPDTMTEPAGTSALQSVAPGSVAGQLGRVTTMVCDAERVDEVFEAGTFDLVFSSNMLEHLPDPGRALRGIRTVLKDDGIAIHVIPSPFWKLSHLAGFYPNAVLSRIERRARRGRSALSSQAGQRDEEWDNNPKVANRQRPYLARLLWPAAHGASGSNVREFALFSRRYWLAQFEAAGFCVAAMQRGPVSSGYGFGLDGLRTVLEGLGLSSETIYITYKVGSPSGRAGRLRYFDGRSK